MSSHTTEAAGTAASSSSRPHAALHGVLAAGLSILASAAGGLVTRPQIPTWYATLEKPFFNPPNWVFGPVWTILFAMMAYAFWRILRQPPGTPGRGAAIAAYLVQLALNVTWSVVFFGLNSPAGGFVVIGLFLVAIGVTIRLFAGLDRPAAWLLAPYLAWVSFASVLNASIWWLNG
jgi:tryptophan-rich sensory protein